MNEDYSPVTEMAGNRASTEQLEMIHTRYHLAREYSREKDVLEAACGPGRGLGFLALAAKSVTGLDLTESFVTAASERYHGRIRVVRGDAQKTPFADDSFDTVILFEAVYYLPDAGKFVSEARRVLRPGGVLVMCSANREWPGFNPSPFSVRYHSADELRLLLAEHGFSVEILAGFPAVPEGPLGRIVNVVRRLAVALRLVPRSMKGKAWLKRVFYGRLRALGPEIESDVPVRPLQQLRAGPVRDFKVLYAVGHKPQAGKSKIMP